MSSEALERLRAWRAEVGIVLGSGLSGLVEANEEKVAYSEFPEIPVPTVAEHPGHFVAARFGRTPVICAQGRAHLYEGHSAAAVTAAVRTLAGAGIKRFILTNAAGIINPAFRPGSWMMLTDHLNLTGLSPLVGRAEFLDLTEVYSAEWRAEFRRAAHSLGLPLYEGVYAGVIGPQYETPAEVRMLHTLGADAVGMSTVIEAIQARALGLQVVAFSCLTNFGAGLGEGPLRHGDVVDVGRRTVRDLARLLTAVL